jgi:hypothetical protein
MEAPRLRVTFGALRGFGVTAVPRRLLAALLPDLERRRIAHPRLRTTPIFKVALQQGFAIREMGIDQIALQNS